jgi:excinuclease ABC subunit A
MEMILNGGKENSMINSKDLGVARDYKIDFGRNFHFIKNQYDESA